MKNMRRTDLDNLAGKYRLYKDGGYADFDRDEREQKLADGWFTNPTDGAKKPRTRRTKAEMEAARAAASDTESVELPPEEAA